jgi:hypothetical protein
MTTALTCLPPLTSQAERLIDLGVHELAGLRADELRAAVQRDIPDVGLLAVHPDRLAPSVLAPLVHVEGRPAFVVVDMPDLDAFAPIAGAAPPETPVYVLHDLDRGDAMRNWSPDEALTAIASSGRTPLTISEGLHWLLQQPDTLERNSCFMTIGSRLRKPSGKLDARTPALWFSNGTGRDGRERRHAPKVGWCWAGNRHTWLGFATAAGRSALGAAAS